MKSVKVQCPACGEMTTVTATGRLSRHHPAVKPEHWTDSMYHWNSCAGRQVRVTVIRCRKKHHAEDARPCGKVLRVSIDRRTLRGLGKYLRPTQTAVTP